MTDDPLDDGSEARLLDWAEIIRTAVRNGRLSVGSVRALLHITDPVIQVILHGKPEELTRHAGTIQLLIDCFDLRHADASDGFRRAIHDRLTEMMKRSQIRGLHDFIHFDRHLTPAWLNHVLCSLTEDSLPRYADTLIRLAELADHNPVWLVLGVGRAQLPEFRRGDGLHERAERAYKRSLSLAAKFALRWRETAIDLSSLWRELENERVAFVGELKRAAAQPDLPQTEEEMIDFWNRRCLGGGRS